MTNDEMTDAEVDAYFADLAERASILRDATCEEIAALSAKSEFDLIGKYRGLFADTLMPKDF